LKSEANPHLEQLNKIAKWLKEVLMPVTLSGPVGEGPQASNQPSDVIAVKRLLNQISRQNGGSPQPPLSETASHGQNLITAIKRFQWRLFPQRQQMVDGLVEPRGSTLREMNRLANGEPHRWPRPTGQRGRDIPLYITEMWNLIQRMHTLNLSVFPCELLVGLFWEESAFINTRGRNRHDMIGFGQVHVGNFRYVNDNYGRHFTATSVLNDNSQSVELASFWLDLMRRNLLPRGAPLRDQRSTLVRYATGSQGGSNPVIRCWVDCMSELQSYNFSGHIAGQITDEIGIRIRTALWKARPGIPPIPGTCSVWSPDMAVPLDL
jgi:hypothetical protein